jgi:hypothetical protein
MVWYLVIAGAVIALAFAAARGKNSIWGGATIGVVVGVVLDAFGPGFDWWTVAKSAAVGALIGLVADLAGSLSDRLAASKHAVIQPEPTDEEKKEAAIRRAYAATEGQEVSDDIQKLLNKLD